MTEKDAEDYVFRYPYKITDLIQSNSFGCEDIGLVLEVRYNKDSPSLSGYKKEYYNYTVFVLNSGKVRNWIHFKTGDDYFLISETA
jgi:hypothetical protein